MEPKILDPEHDSARMIDNDIHEPNSENGSKKPEHTIDDFRERDLHQVLHGTSHHHTSTGMFSIA
jgi:hypothetical protein